MVETVRSPPPSPTPLAALTPVAPPHVCRHGKYGVRAPLSPRRLGLATGTDAAARKPKDARAERGRLRCALPARPSAG